MSSPALFLDRDGVINIDHAYVYKPEHFEFINGIFDVCRKAKQLGFLICVVTNQAGIGRGYYSENDFLALNDWMCEIFRLEDAAIDKVYFCPTHPVHGVGKYKTDSLFRKPNPGMILKAVEDLQIDVNHSVLVGDKETDIQAGIAAGVGCNLLFHAFPLNVFPKTVATSVISDLVQILPFLEKPKLI